MMSRMGERLRQWGTNLRVARDIQGLTQIELARLIGVRQASIARWETGQVGPTDSHKVKIAAALHQDVRMLFPLFAEAS